MKLLRYGNKGAEKPGILGPGGTIRDLSGIISDINGEALQPDNLAKIAALDPQSLPEVPAGSRLGQPVTGIGKIMCIGKNYAEHARETGSEPPTQPMLFMKATSALNGPFDDVMLPKGAECLDWEVELAIVIGKRANYVSEDEAFNHIAGFTVMNDFSERDFQKKRGGQFTKGKSADTFGPLGPYLVTPDEISNPQDLPIWLDLNGERRQDGRTKDMIFGIKHLVSHLSHFMSLMPGDIISTGTPDGVGMGCTPPRFLKAGDELVFGVNEIGEQRHKIVSYSDAGLS